MSAIGTALTIGGTAAGTVAVFAGGLLADTWRTRLGIKAAREERDALRSAEKDDRRDAFELDTLLSLQDVIQTLARQNGRAHLLDEDHFRSTGKWVRDAPLLPDEVGGEASLVAGREFIKLRARIPGSELRQLLVDFNDALARYVTSGMRSGTDTENHDYAQRMVLEINDLLERLHAAFGERIRELHEF